MSFVDVCIEAAKEIDGVQIFAAAEFVRNPFALLSGVIQIKHGSHGVNAQPVSMINIQPKHCAAHQKTLNLVAPVIENETSPIRMKTLAGIGMLVKVRSIKITYAVLIGGKMRWNPIKVNADFVLMEIVNEEHEVLRRAVAAGRSKIASRLVAPRSTERMLHHRQKLHMREAQPQDIIRELFRQLAVRERPIPFLRHSRPRTEMNLINRLWATQGIILRAARHPFTISPFVAKIPHNRC